MDEKTDLFQQFDNRSSSRSKTDVSGAFQGRNEEIPNAATREAMRAADAGELTHFGSVAEMFEDIEPPRHDGER